MEFCLVNAIINWIQINLIHWIRSEGIFHFVSACKCPCRRRGNPRHDNVTKETYKEIADETKKEIAVDKKATAVSFRRKNSATDERPEARNIGAVGIVMLSVVLGAIVLADLLSLKIYIQNYLRRASGQ